MARRRREPPKAPYRLILDSGVVIALARGDERARAFLKRAFEQHASVEIPVVVLAETLRGSSRDALLHRILNAAGTVPHATEAHGRIAGKLLGEARSAATLDALVVAQAIEGGGARILTGDPEDLERLAAKHPEVEIHRL